MDNHADIRNHLIFQSNMTEIEDLITRYNVDSRNNRLRNYYEADNLWRTLRIERDENRHSSFLAWLLNKEAHSDNGPLYKFLNLIVRRKEDCTKPDSDYKELKKAILSGKLKLKSVQIKTEKVISSLSKIRFNDRLDIYVDCEISEIGNFTRLEIIIENKIDSSEGIYKTLDKITNLTKEEEFYKGKKQTERYFYACSKDNNLRNDPFEKEKTLQLFVFLSPKEQKPKDINFVKISYQDLVDFIIEPYLNREDIDSHTSMSVKEYLRILGNPINNMTIMAKKKKKKELLIDFYDRNEDLFRRALEVKFDNAESEEEEKIYGAMLNSIKNQKTHIHRFFKINGNGNYKMYEVVAEFVKERLKEGETYADIDKTIGEFSKEKTVCHISKTKESVKKSERSFEANYNGETFYVTKEWGMGKSDKNFDGLMKKINQNDSYKFNIQEI